MHDNNSVIAEKNYQDADECPIRVFIAHIGGKWKPVILCLLSIHGVMRFGELDNAMAGISQKVLSQQLRELEQIGLIHRDVHPTVPPKVEYRLTDNGESLIPLLNDIKAWTTRCLTTTIIDD